VIDLSDASDDGLPPTIRKYNRPLFALLDRCNQSFAQERLARVGVNLLSHGLSDQFNFTFSIFDILLPQLSHAIPSVNAAAAALGAIYELQSTASSTGKSDERNTIAANQYSLAIKAMQQDLQVQKFGTVPLLMICMLLACSELLLRRRSYSLMHIQAGFKLLEERRAMFASAISLSNSSSTTSSPEENNHPTPSEAPLSDEDEIFLLFRTFDIHSSTYADRRMPTMPPPRLWLPPAVLSENLNPQTMGLDLISTIHSCLYFTSTAGQYKYLPSSLIPPSTLIEQGRHLGVLNAWLTRLDRYVMHRSVLGTSSPSQARHSPSSRTHLLMLRNMCLSTIIFASTILSPYETAWDDYSWYFEEIVSGAEEILSSRTRAQSWSPDLTGQPRSDPTYSGDTDFAFTFTPLPGVIQPLCLTAFKYRHSTYRRRAAQLMRRAGREGPWIGELVAAVADRLIEVEESHALPSENLPTDEDLAISTLLWGDVEGSGDIMKGPASIPENARISGAGMDANINRNKGVGEHDSKNWTARRSGETRARFFRCRDVEGMLEAGLGARGAGVSPWAEGGREEEVDDGSPNAGRPAWRESRYWEDWNEVLKF
jgi:hypothetical protein